MRLGISAELDYSLDEPADVLLAVEAAPMADQQLIEDRLTVSGVGPMSPVPGEEGIGRRTWMHADGSFRARYNAIVEVERPAPRLAGLRPAERATLPALVVPYLFPSRYCEADRFVAFVEREFGELAGGDKIEAMAAWIGGHFDYLAGTSDATTTAADSFVQRQGVCRDFAHMLIAFARAAGLPARMVSAYAWQLEPQDFHAVVEVWLEDGWHLVDPTQLAPTEGLVRIAVGRDATDISFMTIFGKALLERQEVRVERIG